jgi:hypothetical protein
MKRVFVCSSSKIYNQPEEDLEQLKQNNRNNKQNNQQNNQGSKEHLASYI